MMAACLILATMAALLFLRPILLAYMLGGFALGWLIRIVWGRYSNKHARPTSEGHEQPWGISKTEILLTLVIVVFLAIISVPRLAKNVFQGFPVDYHARVTYAPNLWNIEEEVTLEGAQVANESAPLLLTCGWHRTWTVDGISQFGRLRKVATLNQWWPAYSVSVIDLPQPNCGQGFPLRPAAGSDAIVDVPPHFVARTYPTSSAREEILGQDREQITVPVTGFTTSEEGGLRLEVLSPALRNRFCAFVATASGWGPLKWIGVTLMLLFSEQIKRGVLEPFMRWLFRVFRFRYKEGPPPPEPESPLETGEGR